MSKAKIQNKSNTNKITAPRSLEKLQKHVFDLIAMKFLTVKDVLNLIQTSKKFQTH
jgi:hypothetical protein